jgi:hypothetical protein
VAKGVEFNRSLRSLILCNNRADEFKINSYFGFAKIMYNNCSLSRLVLAKEGIASHIHFPDCAAQFVSSLQNNYSLIDLEGKNSIVFFAVNLISLFRLFARR